LLYFKVKKTASDAAVALLGTVDPEDQQFPTRFNPNTAVIYLHKELNATIKAAQ
jgi:hypothetical protein